MNPGTPSPLTPRELESQSRRRLVIRVMLVPLVLAGLLIFLRVSGLIRPFSVSTGAMAPAVSPGDHVLAQGLTYLGREPRRGEVVVFKTEGIGPLPAGIYVKRIAGEPGEHVRLAGGKLFVNDQLVTLSNAAGEIVYDPPPRSAGLLPATNIIVPDGCFFVLGDDSTNSFDSRFWGSVPRRDIIGRVSLCYWPPQRFGKVK